jgi:cyclopropane fatty-acyl-phospholipid synthase-like methyltransferase
MDTGIRKNQRTAKYDPNEFYMLSGGPGGVYLADQLAEKLQLLGGERVLDLGAGHLVSSILLAKEFKVIVYAYDLWVSANEMYEIVRKYNLEDRIIPINGEADKLPFPHSYFDKVFSMGSYFYFGQSKKFTLYILDFLKPLGLLGIADGCLNTQDNAKAIKHYSMIPEIESILKFDHYVNLLTENRKFGLVYNDFAVDGFEMWQEYFRKTYEIGLAPPWGNDNIEIIKAFERDDERLLSNQITVVQKLD